MEGSMRSMENDPLSEAELNELEGVVEQHKTLTDDNHGYGVFASFCIPRLLATIRNLQREVEQVTKERDEARALLHNMAG
jgi:hypothetical protein